VIGDGVIVGIHEIEAIAGHAGSPGLGGSARVLIRVGGFVSQPSAPKIAADDD
jgi:hypothetical protein